MQRRSRHTRAPGLVLLGVLLSPSFASASGGAPPAASPDAGRPEVMPAAAQVAQAPRVPDVQFSVGETTYAGYLGDTRIWLSPDGESWKEVPLKCGLSALGAQGPHLYAGCDDGQVIVLAINDEHGLAPAVVATHQYPGPVRGFVIENGTLTVDAPAAAAGRVSPPPPTVGEGGPSDQVLPHEGEASPLLEQSAADAAARARHDYLQAVAARDRLKPWRAMMGVGFGLTGAAYLGSIVATPFASLVNEYAVYRFIPVIGPFIAMRGAIVPVIHGTFGGIQLAGVVLGGVGAGLFVRDKKRLRAETMALRGGSGLRFRYDF